jgi:hypothetical protein
MVSRTKATRVGVCRAASASGPTAETHAKERQGVFAPPFSPLKKIVPMNVKLRISTRTQLEKIHALQLTFPLHPLPIDAIQ